jgi:heme/copper-type cytochrome/quinol oxidase subunit 2
MDKYQKKITEAKTGMYIGLAVISVSIILFVLSRLVFDINLLDEILLIFVIITPSFVIGSIIFVVSLGSCVYSLLFLNRKNLDDDQKKIRNKSNLYVLLTILFSLIIIVVAVDFNNKQYRQHKELQETSSEIIQESEIRLIERTYGDSL